MNKKILITWWLWFVWSNVVVQFVKAWYNVIVIDNISSSSYTNLADIEEIVGKWIRFYDCDLKNKSQIDDVFQQHEDLDWVVHCAHIRPLGEKQEDAFLYYNNNVIGTINLLEMIYKYWIQKFINTSTASLYNSKLIPPPYSEEDPISIKNTFTTTCLVIEQMLDNIANRYNICSASLRITKTIWANHNWFLWRKLTLLQNDIVNYIYAVAIKKFNILKIKTWDYDTKDGTFAWDYIHIEDVANAYLKTYQFLTKQLEKIKEDPDNKKNVDCHNIFNIWSWKFTTVLELIRIAEDVIWKQIPYVFDWQYTGDDLYNIVLTDKAKRLLNWSCEKTIQEALQDWWKYVNNHF